ncbi:MAG: hypothetical protein ACM3UZ_09895, partial [Acidobacteriota bacterium]
MPYKTRIVVDTAVLRQTDKEVDRMQMELQATRNRLQSVIQSLDWQGERRNRIQGKWEAAAAIADKLINQASGLSTFLQWKAAKFEEMDGKAVDGPFVFLWNLDQGLKDSGFSAWEGIKSLGKLDTWYNLYVLGVPLTMCSEAMLVKKMQLYKGLGDSVDYAVEDAKKGDKNVRGYYTTRIIGEVLMGVLIGKGTGVVTKSALGTAGKIGELAKGTGQAGKVIAAEEEISGGAAKSIGRAEGHGAVGVIDYTTASLDDLRYAVQNGHNVNDVVDDVIKQYGSSIKEHPLRQAYESDVRDLKSLAEKMASDGVEEERIARVVHQDRRELGIKYKELTPEPLREYIYEKNMRRYKDP